MLLSIDKLVKMNRRRSWDDDIHDLDRRLLWDSARQIDRLSRLVIRQARRIETLEAEAASQKEQRR